MVQVCCNLNVSNLQILMILICKKHHQSPHISLTQPGKHALTPESKAAAEKKPKRFAGIICTSDTV